MADPIGVCVAFDAPWDAVSPSVWNRIDNLAGARVQGWQIDRGRPDEFSKVGTGTARVTIVDRQGLFDPTNASSPYNGKLVPGKPAAIAIRNPENDTWHTRYRGFVDGWSYRLDRTRQYMQVELELVDGFSVLSQYELQVGVDGALPPFTGSPQKEKLAELAAGNVLYGETEGPVKDRIHQILGDAGWPAGLALPHDDPNPDIFTGNVRVGPKAYGPGTAALAALQDCADAEFAGGVAMIYMSADGHVTFHGRQARFRPDVAQYGITRYTVGDPSATAGDPTVVPLAELEWSIGADNVIKAASATPQGVGTGLSWRPLDPELDDVAGQLVTDPAATGRSVTFDNLQTIEGVATGNSSMIETRLFATYHVENYNHPEVRINRMVFKTRRPGNVNSSAWWQLVCNIEVSDLLTVKTAHPGGGGFLHEFYVEGIHYTARPGPPDHPIVELSLDVSPRAHWTSNPFPEADA